jgi:hypothetical protein
MISRAGIDVDPTKQLLYIAEYTGHRVSSANYDGTNWTILYTGALAYQPSDVVVDPSLQILFFTTENQYDSTLGSLVRKSLLSTFCLPCEEGCFPVV